MTMIHMKLGVLFILLFVSSFAMIKATPAALRDPLYTAMQATGAHVGNYNMNAWAKLPKGQENDSQLQKIVENAMEQMGIGIEDYRVVHQQRGTHRTVQAESVNRDFHVTAIAKVIPNEQNADLETYLVVNIESELETPPSISEMQEKINKIIQKNGGYPKISTCLMGWLDGKLRAGERNEILQKAFMVVDGAISDKLELEQFVSCTGFSSRIEDWVQVGDKKVNINMAMRYSQYDNRTYVLIGSPIITREY
jgi:hypothetical protein